MRYKLKTTKPFNKWFGKLDATTKRKLLARLARVENGNFGDYKQIAPTLYELRFFFGSGYRIYFTIQDGKLVILLVGGDKTSQSRDIAKATRLLNELE